MAEVAIAQEDYVEWVPAQLVDPRAANSEQIIHGMEQIIATEGPVMASRVFQIFARAADWAGSTKRPGSHFSAPSRPRSTRASWLPNRRPRTIPRRGLCGCRRNRLYVFGPWAAVPLHEVPAAEMAEFILEFRVADELISREELFRKVLNEYGLNRFDRGDHQPARVRAEHLVFRAGVASGQCGLFLDAVSVVFGGTIGRIGFTGIFIPLDRFIIEIPFPAWALPLRNRAKDRSHAV